MNDDTRAIADYLLNLVLTIGRLEKRVAELTRENEELRKLADTPEAQEN